MVITHASTYVSLVSRRLESPVGTLSVFEVWENPGLLKDVLLLELQFCFFVFFLWIIWKKFLVYYFFIWVVMVVVVVVVILIDVVVVVVFVRFLFLFSLLNVRFAKNRSNKSSAAPCTFPCTQSFGSCSEIASTCMPCCHGPKCCVSSTISLASSLSFPSPLLRCLCMLTKRKK